MSLRQRVAEQKARKSGLTAAIAKAELPPLVDPDTEKQPSSQEQPLSSDEDPPSKVRRRYALRRWISDETPGAAKPESGVERPQSAPFPSVSWVSKPIWTAMCPQRDKLGTPKWRPRMVSLCTGVGQDIFQATACEMPIARGVVCAELCQHLRNFLQRNHGQHVGVTYQSIAALLASWAVNHGGHPDIMTAGSPCPPFSRQRLGSSAIPAHQHPEFAVTFGDATTQLGSVLSAIETLLPGCGVLENVPGMGTTTVAKEYDRVAHAQGKSYYRLWRDKVEAVRDPVDAGFRYATEVLEFTATEWLNLEKNRSQTIITGIGNAFVRLVCSSIFWC